MAAKKVGDRHGNSPSPGAAVAETYTISDASMSQVQYFNVLAGDRVGKEAKLWSVGTTEVGSGGWTGHGEHRIPTELVARDTAYGADNGTYQSALGANIFITSTGEVGYDMSGMSAATRLEIDDLAVGQSITDSFYYAIELGSGALRWNEVSVVINGAAATVNAGEGAVVENRNVDGNGNLTETEALTVTAASGDATSFTLAPASGATLGTVTLNGATLNPNGSYTLAGGRGAFTYTVSNAAVRAAGLGYGESQQEWFTITTANGTAASFYETVDGNINAPVVTAAAAQNSITQGGSDGLTIGAVDSDNNAALSYAITGVPSGATLTSSADPGGISYDSGSQSWTVAPGALGDLTLSPGAGFSGQIQLSVVVTNTEVNPNNPADVVTAAATAMVSIDVTPVDPPSLTATLFDVPGAYQTDATAINDAGQVAGYYVDRTGQHGFLYAGGNFTPLDPASGASTVVTGINGGGEVVGYYSDAAGFHGFTYDGGAYHTVDASASLYYGVTYTQITAVDGNGDVGGFYQDATGEHGFVIDHANGNVASLDGPQGAAQIYVTALTDTGEVAGYYNDSAGETHGFVYQNAGVYQTLDPPGSGYTVVTGATATGDVIGNFQVGFTSYGFLYDGSTGNFTTIAGPSGAAGAQVSGINSLGQVAGYYYDSAGDTHGFVYAGGNYTMIAGPPDAYAVNSSAINDSGVVVGTATTPSEMSFVHSIGSGSYAALPAPSGAQSAYATAVNDSGLIAGDYTSNAGQYGFLYDPGSGYYATLTVSGAAYDSFALGINSSGEVVGYYDANAGGQYGFTYAAGTYATLMPSGAATGSYASAINGNGDVAGYFQDSAGTHGFVYTAASATYATLDDPAGVGATYATGINDSGTVVGYYDDSNGGAHGFVYQSGNYTTLDVPAASWTQAIAVDDAGAVLGYYGDSAGQHVFVLQNNAVTTLGALPMQSTVAAGFNNSGDVVGSYWDSAGRHGFLYNPGTQQYATLNEPAGSLGTAAYAVNNTGEIVGGYSPIYQHGFLAVPT